MDFTIKMMDVRSVTVVLRVDDLLRGILVQNEFPIPRVILGLHYIPIFPGVGTTAASPSMVSNRVVPTTISPAEPPSSVHSGYLLQGRQVSQNRPRSSDDVMDFVTRSRR